MEVQAASTSLLPPSLHPARENFLFSKSLTDGVGPTLHVLAFPHVLTRDRRVPGQDPCSGAELPNSVFTLESHRDPSETTDAHVPAPGVGYGFVTATHAEAGRLGVSFHASSFKEQ